MGPHGSSATQGCGGDHSDVICRVTGNEITPEETTGRRRDRRRMRASVPGVFRAVYGILSYGLISPLRLGLQHAAEGGVRAVLRVQQITYANSSIC